MTDKFYRITDQMHPDFAQAIIDNGTLREVEMFACTDCGVRSPDRAHYTDEMVCCACQPTHAEWYKERR